MWPSISGRDPCFPAWPDVLQLNAFDQGLRSAVVETLSGIAGLCDGVRCDMAMLLMNPIFERTWGSRAGTCPDTDYWPEELPDLDLLALYRQLLETLRRVDLLDGSWQLCDRTGWPDNPGYLNLVSWCWRNGDTRRLTVVNLSDAPVQGRLKIPWDDQKGDVCHLRDVLTGAVYERHGDELCGEGLYVDLPAWGFHFLEWL